VGNLLLGVAQHVEGFTESEVTHYIKCGEVVHPHHVERLGRVFLDALLELGHELIGVLHEERFLLFESAIRERRREDLPLSIMINIAGLDEVGRPIHCLAVALPVFVRNTTGISFGAMAIDLDLVSFRPVKYPEIESSVSVKPI
jgi:hypothetical protein